jgi:hypothetical protein
MGDTALSLGDLTGAEQWHCASLQSSRSVRESQSIEITLPGLGKVVTERGDIDASREYLRDALRTCVEFGNLSNGPRILVGVVERLPRTDRGEVAARFLSYVRGHPVSTA